MVSVGFSCRIDYNQRPDSLCEASRNNMEGQNLSGLIAKKDLLTDFFFKPLRDGRKRLTDLAHILAAAKGQMQRTAAARAQLT